MLNLLKANQIGARHIEWTPGKKSQTVDELNPGLNYSQELHPHSEGKRKIHPRVKYVALGDSLSCQN